MHWTKKFTDSQVEMLTGGRHVVCVKNVLPSNRLVPVSVSREGFRQRFNWMHHICWLMRPHCSLQHQTRWALTSHSIILLWTWIVFPWSIKTKVPFLRHLENFWPVIVSWVIKKKENRNPNSNPDIAYYSREYITSVTTKALVTNGGIGRS